MSKHKSIQKPTPGRMVLVSFLSKDGDVVSRPAVVTLAHGSLVNATVFTDGGNDVGARLDISTVHGMDARVLSAPHNEKGEIAEGQKASWRYPDISKDMVDVDA